MFTEEPAKYFLLLWRNILISNFKFPSVIFGGWEFLRHLYVHFVHINIDIYKKTRSIFMGNVKHTVSTEREIYVVLVCDKLKAIYNTLHLTPSFALADVAGVFEGDINLYEKHKEEIFKQLGLDEAGIMNYDLEKVKIKKRRKHGRKN